ncbi:hypothetical protein GW793_00795 [bacterium]|nr:hypothetical protein [bacterium]
MDKTNNNSISALVILFIIIGVAARLLPHAPNFTPITAIALFSGTILTKRYAFAVLMIVMIVTDMFLGFHDTMLFTYGSFGLIMLWGRFVIKGRISVPTVLGSALVTSIIFYIVTNFGVWAQGFLYPPTLSGLIQSYVMAIPFFKNTLMSNVVYSGIFFGSYAFVQQLRTRILSASTTS